MYKNQFDFCDINKILLSLLSENQVMKGKILCVLVLLFSFSSVYSQNEWLWSNYGRGHANGLSNAVDNYGSCFLEGRMFDDTVIFGNDTLRSSQIGGFEDI